MRVLYVSTEVYPALKTGGLADVNAALPKALIALGVDVRLLLPAFPTIVQAATDMEPVAGFPDELGGCRVTLWRAVVAGLPAYLIEAPQLYDRPGNPYVDESGREWHDSYLRFALLGRIAARFGEGRIDRWRPDIVHGHDWHAGLAPAYIAAMGDRDTRPASVFTVHNLAFQGRFPASVFSALDLPASFFSMHGLEFYGDVNFMKAGLYFADRVTTVSPTYAHEIVGPDQGFGMDGVLRARANGVVGIVNGVDSTEWNPRTDANIAAVFHAGDLRGKSLCKVALQRELGLSPDARAPLIGIVSRLTEQKGLDLLLGAIPRIVAGGGQIALLGSGEAALESAYGRAASQYPGSIGVRIGYDEGLAHRVIGGADVIAVPSRYEPCGLTQMYGLAYGSLPLVRRVGGLADTVTDANPATLATGAATGFVFDDASGTSLESALARMFALWDDPDTWAAVRRSGMREDHSWTPSAKRYADVYRELRPLA